MPVRRPLLCIALILAVFAAAPLSRADDVLPAGHVEGCLDFRLLAG